MIDQHTILPFQFYTYEKPFTGSSNGQRYRIIRTKTEEEENKTDLFTVSIWPEPNAYEHTDASLIKTFTFPFTEEGYEQVLACLNEHIVS